MALIAWRDRLSIGVPEIDRDHQELIRYLNAFHRAVEKGEKRSAVGRTLVNLIEYTQAHFEREERVMRAVGYPRYAEHKAAHEHLSSRVKVVAQRFAEDPDGPVEEEVFNFLSDWLTGHIIGMDRDIAEHTNSKKVWVRRNGDYPTARAEVHG